MNELEVKIVRLEAMRVATFHAFGASPEIPAGEKLAAWARQRGLAGKGRIFGFNNPNPSPGSPNYGYEFWLELAPDVEVEDDIEVKQATGGLYAVTRCVGVENIEKMWSQLAAWRESSAYKLGQHQWLEEQYCYIDEFDPDTFTLDLYLPIVE